MSQRGGADAFRKHRDGFFKFRNQLTFFFLIDSKLREDIVVGS